MRRLAMLSLLLAGVALGYGAAIVGKGHSQVQGEKAQQGQSPARPERPKQPEQPEQSQEIEKNVRYLKPGETKWFLSEVRIQDFASELGQSETLKTREPKIEGCFGGEVTLIDGRIWQMKMSVLFENGGSSGVPLAGDVSVRLWEDGRLLSHSSGSGEVRDLRKFASRSEAVIVEATENQYFQMYAAGSSRLIGNFYLGSAPGKFEFEGTARLKREVCGND